VQEVTGRLYVLDYGKLIASGSTADVLADPDVRAAYLGVTA
jgi:ABC-type branched-subunit amino acid transport system ATPase component